MTALLIIFIVLSILLLMPLGIDGGFSGNEVTLGLKIGPFNLKLLPSEKKKATKAKKPKKKKEPKKESKKKAPSPFEKLKTDEGRREILDILKIGLKALGRFKKKLSVDYLRVRVTVATHDPFRTAIALGTVSAVASAFFLLIEEAFNIKEREYAVEPDFFNTTTQADIWLTATINLLQIFYIAIMFGIDILRLKLKQMKNDPKRERKK